MDGFGPLANHDHEHLNEADILFVWSSKAFRRTGKAAVGTAQLGRQQGSLGKKEFLEAQYRQMNGGELPNFVITICAPYVVETSPQGICALIEHELYHCSFATNRHGDEIRNPITRELQWSIKGHDVEEFEGVVRRYGATSPALARMAKYIAAGPEISSSELQGAICGCGAVLG